MNQLGLSKWVKNAGGARSGVSGGTVGGRGSAGGGRGAESNSYSKYSPMFNPQGPVTSPDKVNHFRLRLNVVDLGKVMYNDDGSVKAEWQPFHDVMKGRPKSEQKIRILCQATNVTNGLLKKLGGSDSSLFGGSRIPYPFTMVTTGDQMRSHFVGYAGESWKECIHPDMLPYKGDNAIRGELVRAGGWGNPYQQDATLNEDGTIVPNIDAIMKNDERIAECVEWLRSNMQGFVEVNEFSETILHTVIYSEKASLEHASEWCDQVPLFCPDPSRPSFHPVEVAAETTSALVPSPYKRPSGEVVYIDQSPSKRNHSASVVTSSSSSSASAAGAIAASLSDAMLNEGDAEEENASNTNGRGVSGASKSKARR